ncbi:DUF4271 domain-containing protein [Leeuwenhoekiella marinoflava]|uniref:DUF4271 domain-containing protein n=2 Tax=Leeuwenhoekiella marinoflava TaxID=988 RepID=A0A4Q0PRI5_9FLAO|nr:DUF4271 domain-containing protein [Leeuwenhoekiella marinoflava]RXG33260.1 putative protein DUF4271 [Leeuwenhoekiella marinoflava]SHE44777.1 protein of unknown function [Leeuwenhoekiella marinoflava DSM 3653]
MQALERSVTSNDWITLVFVTSLLLVTVAKLAYESRFVDFAELLINEKYLLKAGKDIQFENPFNLILFTVQFLSISLFLYIAFIQFDVDSDVTSFLLYLRIALAYVVFVSLKFFIERMLGVLFKGEQQLNAYQLSKLSYRSYFALILIPVNAIFVYVVHPNMLIIQIVVGIFLIFNIISLFNTYRRYEKLIYNNLFYFILYLCALEIAPYFILYKVFSFI